MSRNASTQPSSPPDAGDAKSEESANEGEQSVKQKEEEDGYVPPNMPVTMQKLQNTSDVRILLHYN